MNIFSQSKNENTKAFNKLILRETLLFYLNKAYENYPKNDPSDSDPRQPPRPPPEPIFVPTQQIPNHLIGSMMQHNLGTQIDRIQLDYQYLQQIYDVFEGLGLCTRRFDTRVDQNGTQIAQNAWMAWTFSAANQQGFPQRWSICFKHIYKMVFDPECKTSLRESQEFITAQAMNQLIQELVFRMLKTERLCKQELAQLGQQYLTRDKHKRQVSIIKKLLKFIGIISKQSDGVHEVNMALLTSMLTPQSQKFGNIYTYLMSRIKFLDPKPFSNSALRAPPSQPIAGYAQLKGRMWQFTLTKLYCIIGRAPYHYQTDEVWHVDIDLGHLKKVSRQHCLIIWNSLDMCWEIKCISRKYPVLVGGRKLQWSEPARSIKSGEIVQISGESFFWFEARDKEEGTDQKKLSSTPVATDEKIEEPASAEKKSEPQEITDSKQKELEDNLALI